MQGSVYAAPITEEDLKAGGTKVLDSNIGPIYIIGNKEKEYTVKTDNPDGFKITPEGNGAILVGIEWNNNDNIELSKLTIDNNVTIGSNEEQQITITSENGSNALIQVGGYSGQQDDAGQLTINGNLNIENIDFSGMQNLISAGGGTDWFGNTGGFSVKDITIDNVDGGDTAGLINLGSNTVTGNVTVTNSTAKKGIIIGSGAQLGNITFENVNFGDSEEIVNGTILADSDGRGVKGSNFTSGSIVFKGNDKKPATFGQYLFQFQNNREDDEITINGNVVIENAKGTYTRTSDSTAAFYAGRNTGNPTISLEDIKINNLEMIYDGTKDVGAVRIDNGIDVNIDNIVVENVAFSGNSSLNMEYGVYFGSSAKSDQKINNITVSNITSNAIAIDEGLSGVRLQTSKLNDGIGSINVSNISGVNGQTQTYGLYMWKMNDLNIDEIKINDIYSLGHYSRGAYINDSTLNINTVNVNNVNSTGWIAYGFVAYNGSEVNVNSLNVSDVKSAQYFSAGVYANNSKLNAKNAVIDVEDGDGYQGHYSKEASNNKADIEVMALRSVNGSEMNWDNENGVYQIQGTIIAGNDTKGGKAGTISLGGAVTQIYGDVFAGNGGEIDLKLTGENSFLDGQIDDYHELANSELTGGDVFHNSAFVTNGGAKLDIETAGKISLSLNDKAKWIARGQNFLSSLENNGYIDMTESENSSITTKTLSGNGTIKMLLNADNKGSSDMLYVTESMTGTQTIDVEWANGDGVKALEEGERLRFATTNGNVGHLNARTNDTGFFNIKYKTITDEYDKDDYEEKQENIQYNDNGNGLGSYKPGVILTDEEFDETGTNHYITGIDDNKSEISDAGQTIINMSRANYSNAIYMDRLNKRIGEARYINPEDEQGMWVRLRHDRIGKEEAFRSQNTMYEMGYDVKQDCDNGDRRVGFAIDYMDGKTEYRNVAGDGDIKRYGLWLYDTWMGDKGHYADYVLKWGHLENDFDIYNSRGKVNGDYSNNVFSVSAEYGKKNDMGNDWYFEPQAQLQLARVTGADYVTSQNTKVSLDGINSLIGRAGFRLGKDMGERSTVYVKADVLHEFLGDQTISALDTTTNGTYRETFENKGTWYDVGFGFATALGKDSYAFMDFEKSFGNDNDETYQINAGVQWMF